jgi:hypothetical protein
VEAKTIHMNEKHTRLQSEDNAININTHKQCFSSLMTHSSMKKQHATNAASRF